ncbi:hypothetical protein SISSUDRAFT_593387 [Sistotremastrum suecicum HHB10207 ss-3]|uniref:Uncharacterized protein n=1 Tax=Sistotremastrum suecicum HHB10207 ss-3 TaxID=1314776 RepID=A0A165XBE0_9AGAM|nr:hypothetical protein SISSUDRAFT_593387 [Sistotremastrum suecicum HHB10207 ss-3]
MFAVVAGETYAILAQNETCSPTFQCLMSGVDRPYEQTPYLDLSSCFHDTATAHHSSPNSAERVSKGWHIWVDRPDDLFTVTAFSISKFSLKDHFATGYNTFAHFTCCIHDMHANYPLPSGANVLAPHWSHIRDFNFIDSMKTMTCPRESLT